MSKFGLFSIGKKFGKEFSNHIADKKIIKWELLPTKNLLGQYEIIYEYEELKD
jgi:hypothetical protein